MTAEISNLHKNIMGTMSFDMKIKGMRKSQEFVVYPISSESKNSEITIQSDKRIARLNLETGKGRISENHRNGAFFVHFSFDKLTDFELSPIDLQTLKLQIFTTSSPNAGKEENGIVSSDNSGAFNII
jgi:hypothetical protein